MGKRKTAIEQLESLNKKQEQMKAQEKLLKQRIAEENRPATGHTENPECSAAPGDGSRNARPFASRCPA